MSNTETAFEYFLSHGFTAAQSAGIVGNLVQESGVNPESIQSGGPGRGIAQWSQGGRWIPSLMTGNPARDLQAQLNEINQELQSNPSYGLAALRAINGNTPSAAEQAAQIFGSDYERYGIAGARVSDAAQVLSEAQSGHWPLNSTGSISMPSSSAAPAPSSAGGLSQFQLTSSVGGSVLGGILSYIFGPAAGLTDVGKIAASIGTFIGVAGTSQPQTIVGNTFLSSVDELLNPSISLFAPWKVITMFLGRSGIAVLGFTFIFSGLVMLIFGTQMGRALVGDNINAVKAAKAVA